MLTIVLTHGRNFEWKIQYITRALRLVIIHVRGDDKSIEITQGKCVTMGKTRKTLRVLGEC
jgi:hypothetical protein